MKRVTLFGIILGGLWLGGCKGSSSPATPTAPPALAITPVASVLIIGQTQAYTTANGSSTDTVTWTSSDSNVLSIDATGLATARANGVVTIGVTSGAQTASLQVQVVPNYQGTWAGSVTSTACTGIGGFASSNYCTQGLGKTQTITLTLTQSGLAVGGTITKTEIGGSVNGNVTGSIGAGGDITLTGTLAGASNGANTVATLISWNSFATGTKMTGIWAVNVTSPQITGIATVQWSLTGVTLISSP